MAVEAEKNNIPTESKSTEDFIATMKEFNRVRSETPVELRGTTILGSMDVKSLYPSLDKDHDSKIAGEIVTRHAHLLKSFNWKEGSRFLALALNEDQVKDLDLTEVVQTRKFQGGRDLGMTTNETNTPLQHDILQDLSKLNEPSREATEEEQARILGAVVQTATRIAMEEHTFQFNGETHSQPDGAPMGNQVSVELARASMLTWDDKFISSILQVSQLKGQDDITKRYVDDHLDTQREQPPGTRWSEDGSRLIIDQSQVEQDKMIPGDQRTMKLVREHANRLNPRIQMVEDCPSLHDSGMMPVLDLQCWVDEGGFLRWIHYRKPMANPLVPHAVSALPARIRRTTHIQEGVRILRNCCEELNWATKANCLSDFMARLKRSGYDHGYRVAVLNAAIAGYEKQLERSLQPGGKPLHRPDSYQRERRAEIKIEKKSSWYTKGGFDTVLFVPPTPGSVLASSLKRMQETTRSRRDWGFRVVELGGRSIKSQLQTPDPAKPDSCGGTDCLPCLSGNWGICGRNNVCYKICCEWCKIGKDVTPQVQQQGVRGEAPQPQPSRQQVYIGETSRNLRVRSAGHLRQFLGKDKGSPLWKHSTLFHRGSQDLNMFSMKVVTSHKEPLSRQVTEGVLIKNCKDSILNSKAEYKQPRVTRIRMERTLGEAPQPTQHIPPRPPGQPGVAPQQPGPPQRMTRTRGGGRTPPPPQGSV